MNAPTNSALTARYGLQKNRRIDRAAVVVGATGIAAVIVFFIAAMLSSGKTGALEYSTVSYKVLNSNETRVVFSLTNATSSAVECVVQAVSKSHAPVGYKTVRIEPGKPQHVSVTVRTLSKAANATVQSCWVQK